ncbi:MAG: FAD-dependent oxidoreductase, partial [Advenella sp.]
MKRRHFLKHALFTSAATLGAPAIGAKRRPHVVVVGGGFGGAMAAKYLRIYSHGQIDVTLIEKQKAFVSCPMSNLVLVGLKPLSYCTQQYDQLARRWGIRILNQRATKIQAATSRITLADTSEISYDRLIVSPGVDLQWDRIDGMDHPDAHEVVIDAWKNGADSARLRDQIQALRPGGVVAICIPLAPYRCPSAPYERAS